MSGKGVIIPMVWEGLKFKEAAKAFLGLFSPVALVFKSSNRISILAIVIFKIFIFKELGNAS